MERSAPPPLPVPLAPCAGPAPPPGAAMERPGPREGSAEPAGARRSRSAGLRRGTARRAEGGVRAEQGAGTGVRCGAGRGRPEELPLGETLPPESANGARPSGGGGGGGRERTETGPAARGRSAASLTVHGAVRGSRCPGAGGGPDALGVHPGWRAAFLAVRGVEPGVLAVASDRLSLFIANISHAEFALALSVSWAATLVRTCVPKHFFFTRCFYRGKSLITRVACLEEFYMPRLTRQCTK